MLITKLVQSDPVLTMAGRIFVSIRISDFFELLYKEFSVKGISEASRYDEQMNRNLESLIPVSYPKERAMEVFMRAYNLLISDAGMTADPIAAYAICKVIDYAANTEDPLLMASDFNMAQFLEDLKSFANISEEEAASYEEKIYELFDNLESCINVWGVLCFGNNDTENLNAFTRSELLEIELNFERVLVFKDEFFKEIAESRKAGDK